MIILALVMIIFAQVAEDWRENRGHAERIRGCRRAFWAWFAAMVEIGSGATAGEGSRSQHRGDPFASTEFEAAGVPRQHGA